MQGTVENETDVRFDTYSGKGDKKKPYRQNYIKKVKGVMRDRFVKQENLSHLYTLYLNFLNNKEILFTPQKLGKNYRN